jgi:chemotaxis protein MotB
MSTETSVQSPAPPPSGAPLWLVALLLALLVAAGTFIALVYWPMSQDRESLASDGEQLRAQVASLEKERDELRAANRGLQDQATELEAKQKELAAIVAQREAELAALESARGQLRERLASDIAAGDVTVRGDGDMLAVELADRVLFPPGEAELSDRGKEIIERACPSFLALEGRIVEVGGHTDDQPIRGEKRERDPTNWELSTSRATHVVRFMEETCKIPGKRLVAAGFSQFRPVASNRRPAGRSKNRRIEIVLRPPPPT